MGGTLLFDPDACKIQPIHTFDSVAHPSDLAVLTGSDEDARLQRRHVSIPDPIRTFTISTATLDKSNSRVREMFRQIAPRYDAMNHLLSLNIDRYWRRSAVKRLRMTSGKPILDTCTGTGDLAIAIAKKAGKDCEVVGSDFCYAMLEIARDKGLANDATRGIDFLEADSQSLPFEANTFGCVTVAFGLRNVADTDQGLSEMTRVCTGGGQVMVLEFSRPTLPGLRGLYSFYFSHVLPRIGQWFARNNKDAYSYLPESVGQFPDGQALADRMTAAGLTDVKYTPLTFGVATIYEGTKPPMPEPDLAKTIPNEIQH